MRREEETGGERNEQNTGTKRRYWAERGEHSTPSPQGVQEMFCKRPRTENPSLRFSPHSVIQRVWHTALFACKPPTFLFFIKRLFGEALLSVMESVFVLFCCQVAQCKRTARETT